MMAATRRGLLLGRPAPVRPVATIGDGCLARHGVVCRSCGDACEPRAIRFTLAARGVSTPALDRELCTGCGDCIEVCPAMAIVLPAAGQVACHAG